VPDPDAILAEGEETLTRWGEVAERAFRDGRDIAAALEEAFAHDFDSVDPEARTIAETLNGVHSNAAGLRRWLEQRSGRTEQGTRPQGQAGATGPATAAHDHGHGHHHPH
jgi:hypothetical protein